MRNLKAFNALILGFLAVSALWITSCDTTDPDPENEEEIITDVVLTFTPTGGGAAVTASAVDADGDGPNDIAVSGPIALAAGTEYTLAITLENSIEGESITDEVNEESGEHMFFFEFTDGIFSDPAGDGNVDARADAINYGDQDGAGLPLGLSTTWTAGTAASGTFRVILKHQPDGIKTATSTATDGDSDIDLTWTLNVE